MSPRSICLGCSFLLLGLFCIVAEEQTPLRENEYGGDFDRLAKIFALPGGSKLKGEPWVVVETGPANWFPMGVEGWLIEKAEDEIAVLDWYGEIHTLRIPGPNEKQPVLEEDEDGSIPWDDLPGAEGTVAWKIRREDYHAKSKKFLADGLPKKEDKQDGVIRLVNNDLKWHVVDAARYAHFAHHLGRKKHAEELYAHTLMAYRKYADTNLGGYEGSDALPVFVANTVASGKINWAISCGHRGTPRKELKRQWEKIAALPYHEHKAEAASMAGYYRKLLDEDARWVEPDPETFAKFTTEEKVAYWLYHLRDLDIVQRSFPGRCHVVGLLAGRKKPNPAAELEKLGMAAVPELIAHLDDARPTRSKAACRPYWSEGHYLLRYGDCCQQIFESITGEKIFRGTTTVSYPIGDGAAKECKEKAETWWREYQKKNRNGGMIDE